jgi:hypothetical protein
MSMRLQNQRVHGTYPRDRQKDASGNLYVWLTVCRLKPLEAARVLGFDVKGFTLDEKREVKAENWYPFLNKGFIALGDGGRLTTESQAQARESLAYGVCAIYLHDGHFSIVKKTMLTR